LLKCNKYHYKVVSIVNLKLYSLNSCDVFLYIHFKLLASQVTIAYTPVCTTCV